MLQQCVRNKNDNPQLLAWVAGGDASSIITVELQYHRSCYRSYTLMSTKQNVKIEEKNLRK